jgi:hypothetical protein
MNFLEKDLETIIFENYEACYTRGLAIDFACYPAGDVLRLRQPSLAPYGTPDLVNINYSPERQSLHIQIIECKKDAIDLDTYLQAKRYVSGYRDALRFLVDSLSFLPGNVFIKTVLIGKSFDPSAGFAYLYNDDPDCSAYTYHYSVEGIRFDAVPKGWRMDLKHTAAHVLGLVDSITAHMDVQAEDHYDYQRLVGDPSLPLLVTRDGVLLNTQLLNS